MIVRIHTVGPFAENTYLVGCRDTAEAALVDPGGALREVLGTAERLGLRIGAIWLTHAHVDHVAGVPEAVERTGAEVLLHADDAFLYEVAPEQARQFGLELAALPEPGRRLRGGEVLALGSLRVEVRHVPGHSPGHVAYWIPSARAVFSGDCVFAGSIGRTDLPGGSHTELMASIEEGIFTLGDDVRIYPGHGPPTTVGRERRTNPFFGGGLWPGPVQPGGR